MSDDNDNDNDNDTVKYHKTRNGRRRSTHSQQRLQQSAGMCAGALMLCMYTWNTLWSFSQDHPMVLLPGSGRRSVMGIESVSKSSRRAALDAAALQHWKQTPHEQIARDRERHRGTTSHMRHAANAGGGAAVAAGAGAGARGGDHPHPPPHSPPPPRTRKPPQAKAAGLLEGLTGFFNGGTNALAAYEQELVELDERMQHNLNRGIRWARPELLPPLHSNAEDEEEEGEDKPLLRVSSQNRAKTTKNPERFFHVHRLQHTSTPMAWEDEAARLFSGEQQQQQQQQAKGPTVDYTKHSYLYPEKIHEPPATLGDYPPLVPMKELYERWPQDDVDHPPTPFQERLLHFDYQNPQDLEAAQRFRDAKLPFKLVNVPEVALAGDKWTDEYLSYNFDPPQFTSRFRHDPTEISKKNTNHPWPRARGTCQESPDNFFAFFAQGGWPVAEMGLPPTRNSDYTYEKWAQHASYADAVGLDPNQPHLYYQAGVDREERLKPKADWTFISRDLPSFSSRTETFFVFEVESQKGIQCRFGERGVTAATHFDSGRNMVAMVKGAKRYVLSPPRECSKLGIVTNRGNPIFRHSMLNFGHLSHMHNHSVSSTSNVDADADADTPRETNGMSQAERDWMERAGNAMAIDTVLKAGEVLYIPSHWFHYITSLQKSAQCNVRSGVDVQGDTYFGGKEDVTTQCDARLHP